MACCDEIKSVFKMELTIFFQASTGGCSTPTPLAATSAVIGSRPPPLSRLRDSCADPAGRASP